MLPERRKSAEEIARLRESLGVPGVGGDADGATSSGADPVPTEASPQAGSGDDLSAGNSDSYGESLRDAVEEAVAAAPEASSAEDDVVAIVRPEEVAVPLGGAKRSKVVKSLRRSERIPPVVRAPVSGSRETWSVKKVAAVAPQAKADATLLPEANVERLERLSAKWWQLVGFYLLAATGAVLSWLAHLLPRVPEPDFPFDWLARMSRVPEFTPRMVIGAMVVEAVVLLGAGLIAKSKLRSRHHASLLTILAVVVIAFSLSSILNPAYGT